jgi:hydrogenase nickel incorporation protein HypA/HybF
MHEMSLAENVLELIVESAREQHFTRVKSITLEIGQLAAVEADALRFCFEAVTRNSIAADAKLLIIETIGVGRCRACGATVVMPEKYGFCSSCESPRLDIVSGDQMRVKELSVE